MIRVASLEQLSLVVNKQDLSTQAKTEIIYPKNVGTLVAMNFTENE